MELLGQVASTQILFPAAAVVVVLICAALVFVFGFHSAEQPQFDKLPLVLDDRKSSKKTKSKGKKSSPNRTANEDAKTKSEAKKSPAKEKKEEKVKEEKPKPKERPVEYKAVTKKEEPKKGKKKNLETEKPSDFDEGVWEEVPKKEKKKVKSDDKKESPKKTKKETKEQAKETKEVKKTEVVIPKAADNEEKIKLVSAVGPDIDEEAARALQAQVEEVQRILKEAERREKEALGTAVPQDTAEEEVANVKDLRSDKKKENKDKQKKKASETITAKNLAKGDSVDNSDSLEKQEDKPNAPAFDELGDSWTDAKAPKKGKKKARKDQ